MNQFVNFPLKERSRLPRPEGQWLLGHGLELQRQGILECARHYQETCGDIYEISIGMQRMIILTHPAYVRHVIHDNHENYVKGLGYSVMSILLGNGLLTIDGDLWQQQRRICQPAFSRQTLYGLVPSMVSEAESLAQRWESLYNQQQPVEMTKEMLDVTMRIAAKCLFGSDVERFCNTVGTAMEQIYEIGMRRFFSPIRPPMWVPTPTNLFFRRLARQVEELIQEFIHRRSEKGRLDNDLLSHLMAARDEKDGRPMTERQLRDESMTFFVAGHETTATAMSWTWYLLSQHPKVEERLLAELEEVLGERSPTDKDLPYLKYTHQVILESLRLFPPAWVVGRMPLEDDVIDGYRIPCGSNILFFVPALHRHPDFWQTAEQFDPDRFAMDRERPQPGAYLPFGTGYRSCIGREFAEMEMKILLAVLLRRFRPRMCEGQKVVPDPGFTLRLKYGLKMLLK